MDIKWFLPINYDRRNKLKIDKHLFIYLSNLELDVIKHDVSIDKTHQGRAMEVNMKVYLKDNKWESCLETIKEKIKLIEPSESLHQRMKERAAQNFERLNDYHDS